MAQQRMCDNGIEGAIGDVKAASVSGTELYVLSDALFTGQALRSRDQVRTEINTGYPSGEATTIRDAPCRQTRAATHIENRTRIVDMHGIEILVQHP